MGPAQYLVEPGGGGLVLIITTLRH